jgi:hypothetical protein
MPVVPKNPRGEKNGLAGRPGFAGLPRRTLCLGWEQRLGVSIADCAAIYELMIFSPLIRVPAHLLNNRREVTELV